MPIDTYELVDHDYGKGFVKLLHVRKDGDRHTIRELEVTTALTLNSVIDYVKGDNRDIVATDSQKNTAYILAKKYGVTTPEEFGTLLCRHFLNTYSHILEVKVKVELYPWERIKTKDNEEHNHAFIFNPQAIRTAYVTQQRNVTPKIKTSLNDLRILKTTQSAFVGFVRDEYTTLPEAEDRIFSTVVAAEWEYNKCYGIDFDKAWDAVKAAILETFAGPAKTGVASPSVQLTLYLAGKCALDNVKEISWIEILMPNKHYFDIDFNRFPKNLTDGAKNQQVLQPVDKPSGLIRARLARNETRSKL